MKMVPVLSRHIVKPVQYNSSIRYLFLLKAKAKSKGNHIYHIPLRARKSDIYCNRDSYKTATKERLRIKGHKEDYLTLHGANNRRSIMISQYWQKSKIWHHQKLFIILVAPISFWPTVTYLASVSIVSISSCFFSISSLSWFILELRVSSSAHLLSWLSFVWA